MARWNYRKDQLTGHDESPDLEPPQGIDDERRDEEHLHVVVQVPGLANALK